MCIRDSPLIVVRPTHEGMGAVPYMGSQLPTHPRQASISLWMPAILNGLRNGNNLRHARMTKTLFPRLDKTKTKTPLRHGRAYTHRLIECTTGHNNLNYLQSKIYPEDVSDLCWFCEEEPEPFDHLLNECPCFQQAQFDILHTQPIINTTKWDSVDINAFLHIPAINAALTFE